MKTLGVPLKNLPAKGLRWNHVPYKKELTPTISFPEIGALYHGLGRPHHHLGIWYIFVTQVYTPNAGDGLKRLEERQVWDVKYAEYLAQLDKEKPVLATGDYNVAHKEIDLANPASNRRSPGFTDEERAGFTQPLGNWVYWHLPPHSWWCPRALYLVGTTQQDF